MDTLEEDEDVGNQAGVEAATYLLDDHRFVYGEPDAKVVSHFVPVPASPTD